MSMLDEKQDALLRHYVSLLVEANARARLIGPSDPEVIWSEHILDCLATVDLLPSERGVVLDLGSGGGLPGMVWAVCRPDLQVVLCDSIRKKAELLRFMAASLGLQNVRVEAIRSEELAARERETFLLVGARAVSHLGTVAELCAPLVRKSGVILAMKGPGVQAELQEIRGSWAFLGLASPETISYELNGKSRYLILLRKNAACPSAIPRRPGMAEKHPWWR
jgi:16S rRNA (guanine527-N7)-methyltransferase